MQCKGITRAGTQCTRKGSEYCFQHITKNEIHEIKQEVKTETELIKDLENLSHEYLDPYTYVKLIATDPKLFDLRTYEKILVNHEKIFPLLQYNDIHNEAIKFVDYLKPVLLDGKQKINPTYVASIIMDQISEFGENLESIWDTNITNIMNNRIEITIDQHIKYINSEYS